MSLKVALLNDSFPPVIDGVSNAVFNYASILQNSGHSPYVITPHYPNVTDNYSFPVQRYPSVNILRSMPYRVGAPISPVLMAELIKNRFDIIHCHCPMISGIIAKDIALHPPKQGTPLVFTYHTKFDIEIDRMIHNEKFNKLARKLVLNNINAADSVWLVSKGAEKSIRSLGYTGNVTVMENGTDFPKGTASESEIARIRHRWEIPSDIPLLLYVGRMMWYKNIKLILDSYKQLKASGIPFTAVFVGEGPDRASIEHYAKAIGIYDNCIFTGAVYDRLQVKSFFSCASLFVFPSTFDTSGLVVKEAAACSCPSVLVKDSCAASGIVHGDTGFLSEENPSEFAQTIAELLRCPEKLKEVGKAASSKVYRSWEQTVSDSVREYEKIIRNFDRKSRRHAAKL